MCSIGIQTELMKLKLLIIIDMEKLKNVHPGEILKVEFLDELEISAYRLAKETFIPQTRISQIVSGKRRISTETALRFSKFFGTSVGFWIQLQADFDMEQSLEDQRETLNRIQPFRK